MFSRETDRNHPEQANEGYRATGLEKRRNARQKSSANFKPRSQSHRKFLLDFNGLRSFGQAKVKLSSGIRTWLSDSILEAQFYTWHQHGPLLAESFLASTFATNFLLLYF